MLPSPKTKTEGEPIDIEIHEIELAVYYGHMTVEEAERAKAEAKQWDLTD